MADINDPKLTAQFEQGIADTQPPTDTPKSDQTAPGGAQHYLDQLEDINPNLPAHLREIAEHVRGLARTLAEKLGRSPDFTELVKLLVRVKDLGVRQRVADTKDSETSG